MKYLLQSYEQRVTLRCLHMYMQYMLYDGEEIYIYAYAKTFAENKYQLHMAVSSLRMNRKWLCRYD